jgi:hypothetical protein
VENRKGVADTGKHSRDAAPEGIAAKRGELRPDRAEGAECILGPPSIML